MSADRPDMNNGDELFEIRNPIREAVKEIGTEGVALILGLPSEDAEIFYNEMMK